MDCGSITQRGHKKSGFHYAWTLIAASRLGGDGNATLAVFVRYGLVETWSRRQSLDHSDHDSVRSPHADALRALALRGCAPARRWAAQCVRTCRRYDSSSNRPFPASFDPLTDTLRGARRNASRQADHSDISETPRIPMNVCGRPSVTRLPDPNLAAPRRRPCSQRGPSGRRAVFRRTSLHPPAACIVETLPRHHQIGPSEYEMLVRSAVE